MDDCLEQRLVLILFHIEDPLFVSDNTTSPIIMTKDPRNESPVSDIITGTPRNWAFNFPSTEELLSRLNLENRTESHFFLVLGHGCGPVGVYGRLPLTPPYGFSTIMNGNR